MAKSTVAVKFTGDVAGLKRSIGDVEGKFRGLGSKIGSFAKTAAIGVGAVAVGAGALGKSFVDAAIESQKVTKQTEAVIKSMGGASKITATEVADLAAAMSLKSGVDDELIQSSQNVLLTFGNVRNEVGAGNDIFNQASQAVLDMSVALGTDMTQASTMVGKALNDPIAGLAAMRRVGIQFTEQQEEQIKTMVESGDTLGAQKVMLGELERQFGGSAEAQATAVDKLKVAWGNIQEELGAKLLPVVERVAAWMAETLPGAMDALSAKITQVVEQVKAFWSTLTTGFTKDEGTPIERFALKLRELWDTMQPFVEWLKANWQPILAVVGAAILAITSPIAAVVAALVGSYIHFEGFRNVVDSVVAWVRDNWPQIRATVESVLLAVQEIIRSVTGAIQAIWSLWGDNIINFAQQMWDAVRQIVEGGINIIRGIIQTVTSLIQGDWSGVWEGIKQILDGVWTAMHGLIDAALTQIKLIIGAAWDVVKELFSAAWTGIKQVVSDGIVAVVGFISDMPGRIKAAAAGLFDAIMDAASAAKDWVVRKIDQMLGPIDEVLGKLGSIGGGIVSGVGGALGHIPGFDKGGVVPGRKGSPQLILAHGGETVLPTHRGGGFGQAIEVNVNIFGNVVESMRPELMGVAERAAQAVARAVA